MSDPERIWLQNADDALATGDRLWCQDKVWPECAEQQEPTEYIRADLYASRISQQDAELERLRREVEEARQVADDRLSDNARLTNEKADALFGLAEARKAAFIEAAEIAEETAQGSEHLLKAASHAKDIQGALVHGEGVMTARIIATALRRKAEETGHE